MRPQIEPEEVRVTKINVSTVIDRPVASVWRWYAVEHVRNHPRWDPLMELEQISEASALGFV
jgi:hypothetical protein